MYTYNVEINMTFMKMENGGNLFDMYLYQQ
jgi:hypothetical protein